MNRDDLIKLLAAAADAMRRSDPVWCSVCGVERISDEQWDAVLARVELALDAVRDAA